MNFSEIEKYAKKYFYLWISSLFEFPEFGKPKPCNKPSYRAGALCPANK